MPQDARLQPFSLVGIEATVRPEQRRWSAGKRSGTHGRPLERFFLFLFLAALALCSVCCSQASSAPFHPARHIVADEALSNAPSARSVALRYTFPGSSLALLVTEGGHLHAYDLERGQHAWCADAGGDMVTVTIDLPPSKEAALRDPLALPFLVRGNSLFTRVPFFTYTPLESMDATERLEGLPQSLRPYFFMNISTLLRRQTLFLGGTDVYVTTSVQVADLDASTGRPVGGLETPSQAFCGSNATRSPPRGDSTTESHRVPHNELLPLLHIVRYNIVLHVVRPGEYSWSICLSQLRMSPRAVVQPRFPSPFSAHSAADTSSAAPEDDSEHTPRFFSQFMRNMFDYDDEHVVNVAYRRAADQQANPTPAARTSTAVLMRNLQRTHTQAADYISRVVSVHQVNESHVSLRSVHDGTTAWTSALPHVAREPSGDGTGSTTSSSNATSTVIAAYVWVSGADEIFRVPVLRLAFGSVVEEAEQLRISMETDARGAVPTGLPRLTSASLAGALVPATHAAGRLQLWTLMQSGDSGRGRCRDGGACGEWATDDVEADEREETELAAYYHQCTWWETPPVSWPLLAGAFNGESGAVTFQAIDSATSSRTVAGTSGVYSTENPPLGFDSSGAVVKTGLAWRTAAFISFHVLCLAGSIAFLCAGVPPRGQLQRAWAQADRNRDRVSHTSSSHQPSTQLVPQDLLSPHGGRGTPFSLIMDSFSMDTLGLGTLPTASASMATVSLPHSDDSLQELMRHHQLGHLSRSPPRSPWVYPAPEQVRSLTYEESEKMLPVTATPATTTTTKGTATSSKAGFGMTPSTARQKAKTSETPVKRAAALPSSPADSAAADKAAASASNSSSDDDTVDIDLGERWWLRAQFLPRQHASAPALDETFSDRGSSYSRSQANTGTEEEGKLFQLHFKVLEKIGFGGEGSVFCVEHRVTHARYAIKVIHIHEKDEERVVQEAVLHSSFDNANVVRFYFCWIEDIAVSTANRLELCHRDEDGLDATSLAYSDNSLMVSTSGNTNGHSTDHDTASKAGDTYHMLFIQMEYFPRGTLADWLRLRSGFFRLEVLRYMKQIGEGLAYLHNQDVVHHDLKPTNIFVSNDNVLKIGDFGLAKRRGNANGSAGDLASNVAGGQEERSVVGGSPLYSSPEQTRGEPVNKPSDIFSLGIIAVEMLCTFTTLHERIRILTDAHQLILPEELEAEFPDEAQLIKSMLAANPLQRPPIRKLLRQISKLIVALEAQESDEEAEKPPPPSPLDGAEHSESRNGNDEAATVALVDDSASALAAATATGKFGNTPLSTSVTAASSSCGRSVAADLASGSHVDSFPSPLGEQKSRVALLPVLHSEAATGISAAAASHMPATTSAHDSNAASTGKHVTRLGDSLASLHASTMVKRGNTYHHRRRGSASPNMEAEIGRLHICEMVATGSASRKEFFANDPYGLPNTPVMYTEDADLSTILKHDLQDRTVSAPD
ncbi:putative eukaryotic translation initiation factor 2-alpha kinase precursor [Leishmania infantum JPCM5]|uniref:non-specific serine/threonine protein kinase n=2 Tax=Leishmania infantum TaxID=5671 RepID=A0A6L0Y058_LEIIN|nr:putative eukaryotic translation initiation factor 2-alpha kinase precursor [Leishmania infantum JPCM5]CAC9538673.1 eukaryotic_translation_initiation_factor_2 -alpha_kinase_-_putative [Leishmania infantum]CAM71642.1 putative eukaryotic translation initiation factor 2-alpha kinase precursor [Leishmania infantum JPCM5]SUZ45574.1 eukaryotic_translation_initiation_factor_2 -alpha_kinase_-_putative [Leishmania infantum]|eukprot:XP_001468556.1 putative eukaryotic translation initiation factor 2-alpha kinase precursor [Leishmania infantum JPCM5]